LSERPTVLLLPLEGRLDDISGRLLLVHYRGRIVSSLPEAERLLQTEQPPIRAAILSSEPKLDGLAVTLRKLREASADGELKFVALGARPSESARQKLRSAGVDWALYDAFSDTELRFLLNQAYHEDDKGERREEPRIPTTLTAKVKSTTGTKVAMVYNLSSTGAYLETLRPSQVGVRIEVELPLPAGAIELPATVVSTNVTGNLRRENLPRGMGVRFESLTPEREGALTQYIEERAAAFRP
jgi:hypothetical protein